MGLAIFFLAGAGVGVALIVALVVSLKTGRIGDFFGVFILMLLVVGVALWFFVSANIHGGSM
jgi:hypothetical protein